MNWFGSSVLRVWIVSIVLGLVVSDCRGQQQPLSKRAAEVKRKAESLSPGAKITVVRIQAREEFGSFVASDQDSFTFYDVDSKSNVTLSYADVRKIKDGYGGYNSFRATHTDRTKNIVIAAIVLAGLIGLVFVGARS